METTPFRHLCGCPAIGRHAGAVELVPPDFLARPDGRGICVDVCLALEVSRLWRLGIRTTGCCCGHGHPGQLAYIGVGDECIAAMKSLGYAVQPNPMRPGAEDSFVPLTTQGIDIECLVARPVVWLSNPFGAPAGVWRKFVGAGGWTFDPVVYDLPDPARDHADSTHASEFPEPHAPADDPFTWDYQP